MLLITERTPMIQKMPMIMPSRDREVRSLLERNSCNATLKLLQMILKVRNISRKYAFGRKSSKLHQNRSNVYHRRPTAQDQHPSERRGVTKHFSQSVSDRIHVER